jgi:hypothetical protein
VCVFAEFFFFCSIFVQFFFFFSGFLVSVKRFEPSPNETSGETLIPRGQNKQEFLDEEILNNPSML